MDYNAVGSQTEHSPIYVKITRLLKLQVQISLTRVERCLQHKPTCITLPVNNSSNSTFNIAYELSYLVHNIFKDQEINQTDI
jgi:hypothetical protein